EQVRGTGARGRQADTQPAAELGISRSHEGGHFLVARLDEADLAIGPVQRTEHAVDAVARVSIDAAHAPLVEPFDKIIRDCDLAHGVLLSIIFLASSIPSLELKPAFWRA